MSEYLNKKIKTTRLFLPRLSQTEEIPTTRHLAARYASINHLFVWTIRFQGETFWKSRSWRISSFAEKDSLPESLQLRCVLTVSLLSNKASEYFKELHAIRIRRLFHIAREPRGLNPFAVHVVVTKTNHSFSFYDCRRRGWSASAIHSTWLRAVLVDFPASCMSAVFSDLLTRLDSRQACTRFRFATIERETRCGRRKGAMIFSHAFSRMTFAHKCDEANKRCVQSIVRGYFITDQRASLPSQKCSWDYLKTI